MTGTAPADASHGHTERAAQWLYTGLWRVLVRWFRVPDQPPTLPVRPGEAIQSFQPDLGFLRYLKFWFWIVLLIMDIALTIGFLAAIIALFVNGLWWLALPLIPIALAIIIVPDIIAFAAIHLRYDTTWYVMTERSLRIRRGIWIIHETTITFENVQNMKVTQGPVQRHFGIANLLVETAGAGASKQQGQAGHGGSAANQGVIEGIANAHALRDLILPRLRASRSTGLGDDDDQHAPRSAWTPDHLVALREIREEISALARP